MTRLPLAALLWTIVILRGHRPPPPWRRAVLLGLFEPALAYAGDLLGLARTSAANGALLSGLESVFIVLLAAIFLRERITGRITVALALALAGVATLEGTGSFAGAGLGDLLVLAGVLSAAAYTIVARGMGDESDSLTVTACQLLSSAAGVCPQGHHGFRHRHNPCLASQDRQSSATARQPLSMVRLCPRSGNSARSVTAAEPRYCFRVDLVMASGTV
jgi:drug/metabolite transporter (DMT)-like permease